MIEPSETAPPDQPADGRETARPTASQHLVDVNFVASLWSLPPSAILAMVDCAQINWAWDVNILRGPVRDVRVWGSELVAPHLARAMSAAGVIEAVIGHPSELRLRAQTVALILSVTSQIVGDLVKAGELKGSVEDGTLWIIRSSLINFLADRLIT